MTNPTPHPTPTYTCGPDMRRATLAGVGRSPVSTTPVLVLTPCICGDEDHAYTGTVYRDQMIPQHT